MAESISALDMCSKGFFPKELPPCFKVTGWTDSLLQLAHSRPLRSSMWEACPFLGM